MSEFDEGHEAVVSVFCPLCATPEPRIAGEVEFTCNNCATEFSLEPLEEDPIENGFEGAKICCPWCSNGVDAKGLGSRNYECPTCERWFQVDLEAEVLAEYAMHG